MASLRKNTKRSKPIQRKSPRDKGKSPIKKKSASKKAPESKKGVKTLKIARHTDFLSVLAQKGNSSLKRRHLIEIADKEDINAILQCIYNVIAGNIPLKQNTYTKLKKHKRVLRTLVNKKTSNSKRKAVLKQKGGFLPTLLSAALPALFSIISTAASR